MCYHISGHLSGQREREEGKGDGERQGKGGWGDGGKEDGERGMGGELGSCTTRLASELISPILWDARQKCTLHVLFRLLQ